jgi:TetR/AcrR family transcriptional regulator, transcriptional repressor for nem operon
MKHFSEITPAAERVLDAAQALVQRYGYNGFSYDDIAQQIGIKKPSIHHHFATKAELVATVAQRYSHRFLAQLGEIETTHSTGAARLLAYADLFEQTYLQDRRLCVCGMLGTEADDLPPPVAEEVQAFFTQNLAWLAHVISLGCAAHQAVAQSEAQARAMLIFCALEGAMVVGRGLRSDQGPGRVAQGLIQIVLT